MVAALSKVLVQGIRPASPGANMDDDLGWCFSWTGSQWGRNGPVARCLGGGKGAGKDV